MLSSKFIKFMKILNARKIENLICVINLGRVGIRLAEEYSTRFDLLDIDQCLSLSEFQTPDLEKAEKHLLNLIKKGDPLFSLMEYYDNYPYSYSDINYLFKGCLKTGVEISIKAVDPVAKNHYFKVLNKLKKALKFYNFFMPWLVKKYKADEILNDLEKHSREKFSLSNEIKSTKDMQEALKQYTQYDFIKKARFPKIYSYLSSENMVVSEFIYGSYFYELINNRRLSYLTVLNLIKIQLFFMLKVGTFYNNLHSGNLILSEERYIYFLDCNSISVLTPEARTSLFEILKSLTKQDFKKMANEFNNLSSEKLNDEQLENLITEIRNNFNAYTVTDDLPIIKFMRIFKIASENGIVFDKNVFPIFKSFIYFSKLIKKTKKKNRVFINDLDKILDELSVIIKSN